MLSSTVAQRPSAIPLIRQSDALPALEMLGEVGAPIGKLLRKSELPESFQEGGDGFIPFRTMLGFVGHAARSQDIPDLCWRGVLQTGVDQLGGWGEAVARCRTLRRAILTFCERFRQDAPMMELGLEFGDETVWFYRRRPAQVIGWLGDEEGQQYALASMIRVVRSAAGAHWLPSHIQLESAKAAWTAHVPGFAECQIDLGCPIVAIAVPYDLLDRSTYWPNRQGRAQSELPAAEETLAGSLIQAISVLLPAIVPSLELAAEIAEVSPRRLRRQLAEEHTSWRNVLDEARLDACRRMFRDPKRPLVEIATDLRYSDQAHLSRAFRRWTGECPAAYRRRQSA
jgi:AraC-like DNA-binding protein